MYLHRGTDRLRVDETIERARAYVEAGADCVFPVGMHDEIEIDRLIKALDAAGVRHRSAEKASGFDLARARILLADATGPLYRHDPPRPLGETIWWIADCLQPPPSPPRRHGTVGERVLNLPTRFCPWGSGTESAT